ncbi:MAG TPA: hypothetical protein VGA56_02950, partial [Opitutaceae bacterium]
AWKIAPDRRGVDQRGAVYRQHRLVKHATASINGGMAIRAAAAADFSRIAAIYAFEVLNRTATFELEFLLVDELKRRHAEIIRRNLP